MVVYFTARQSIADEIFTFIHKRQKIGNIATHAASSIYFKISFAFNILVNTLYFVTLPLLVQAEVDANPLV
jgi:hypothetical protein